MNYQLIREYNTVSMSPWTLTSRIFLCDGKPITWKGFSAFRLADLYSRGINISPYLSYFKKYNIARTWTSVPWDDGWDFPTNQAMYDYIKFMGNKGYKVELTLCMDDYPQRVEQSRELINYLKTNRVDNLFLEAVNEPGIHNKLDPSLFKEMLENSGYPYTSGIYLDNKIFYGLYWVDHSARDAEWFRKGGHNLYEANQAGGGPNYKDEPALHIPSVEDEPGKFQDVGFDLLGIYAYAASCVLLGAGGTVHFESGKHCTIPGAEDQQWIDYFSRGLDIFPAGTWNGSYRRIEEPGNEPGGPTHYARTYCTDQYSIRIKQEGLNHPETGWIALDNHGICWKHA